MLCSSQGLGSHTVQYSMTLDHLKQNDVMLIDIFWHYLHYKMRHKYLLQSCLKVCIPFGFYLYISFLNVT